MVLWDPDRDGIGGRLMGLAELVHARRRIGLASESADAGRLVHDALLLVLREAGGRGKHALSCLIWPQRSGVTCRVIEHAISQGDEALGSTTVSGGVGILGQRQQAITQHHRAERDRGDGGLRRLAHGAFPSAATILAVDGG